MKPRRVPPYQYCAARFLDQWERKECTLHAGLSRNPTPAGVRKALASFQVARGFPGLSQKGVTVVRALRRASKRLNAENMTARVEMLADSFKKDFGTRNLSAASKLLWLRCRSPVLIFDARAVRALQKLGHDMRRPNYFAYCKAWRGEYDKRRAELDKAVVGLAGFQPFTASWYKSPAETRADITARWFSERTFDLFLWEIGGES